MERQNSPASELFDDGSEANIGVLFITGYPSRYPALDAVQTLAASCVDGLSFAGCFGHDEASARFQDIFHSVSDNSTLPAAAESVDAVLIEGRMMEAFDDLELIRRIRSARPFLPILLVSANDSLDYKIAAYQRGLSDYLSVEVGEKELAVKLQAMHKVARAGHLVEVQNLQLVTSISALRESNTRLKSEIEAKFAAEKEREKSQIKLLAAEKMASLGEMAGGVAHEINNPLAIIFARIEEMQDHLRLDVPNVAGALGAAVRIQAVSERIAAIVKGLSAFSRNGDKDPFVPTDPLVMVSGTLDLCAERYRNNGVEMRVELPSSARLLECRGVHLSQVLVNLLNNAFDAVRGEEGAWIRLALTQENDVTTLSVEDSGSGIPDLVRAKMWEPFYSTKEVGKGTGLGLAISKGIIEDHGGTIRLDEESAHTRFVIELPGRAGAAQNSKDSRPLALAPGF